MTDVQLRRPSGRPELVVGLTAPVVGPDGTQVGTAGPLGRHRCVFALPTNGRGPVQVHALTTLQGDGAFVCDPTSSNLIGSDGAVWVHRMLYARWTEDTRRLG